MFAEDVVSDQVFQSLLNLDAAASSDVAHRIALATLAGACRAICQMYQDKMDDDHIRKVVMSQLQEASPLCHTIFGAYH